MKINDFGLGFHNPIRKPTFGQQLGDAFVEGGVQVSFARGGAAADLPVTVWVSAPSAIAGAAAGSQAANEALARWLEEIARNPDLNPLLVKWSNARALPQDGWWFLADVAPDYTYAGGGAIPVAMTFRQRAPLGAPVSVGWGGGAMKSAYTAVPVNLLGLPQNATGIISGTRTGSEGGYPYVAGPLSAPYTILPSANTDDLFKAGCHAYDAMAGIATNGFSGTLGLTNGGFELSAVGVLPFSPGSGDWVANTVGTGVASVETVNPDTGANNLKLTNPSNGNYGGTFNRRGLACPPGGSALTISARMKGSAGGATGPIRIVFANAGSAIAADGTATAQPSAQAGITAFDLAPTVTTAYQTFTNTVTVPAGYSWVFVEIYANGNGTPASTFVDNVGFTTDYTVNPNWLEVRGPDHVFTGDLVLVNGLLALVVALNGTVQLWGWRRSVFAWKQIGTLQSVDVPGNVGVPMAARLGKVNYEEVSVDVTFIGALHSASVTIRLQRGQLMYRFGVSPRSFANTGDSLLRFVPSVGGAMVVYNESSVGDQTFGANFLAPTTVYPYGAATLADDTFPWLVAWLYQGRTGEVPTKQPGYGIAGAGLNLGDPGGPAQYGTRFYGLAVTSYATPTNLLKEAEQGSLGTGWSSVGGQADARNSTAAKCASGTLTANAVDQVPADTIRPAGKYRAWFRVKVASNASGLAQMKLSVFDTTSVGDLISMTLAPSALSASGVYAYFSPGIFTLIANHQIHGYVQTQATTTTDWFCDYVVFVPLTQDLYLDGPQDLAQQFLFEKTTRIPVV